MKAFSKFLILFLLLGVVVGARAQDESWTYTPVNEGQAKAVHFGWLSDSSGVVFEDDYKDENVFVYNLQSKEIIPYEPVPLTEVYQFLIDHHDPVYPLFYAEPGPATVFISPNGRFAAYIVDLDVNRQAAAVFLMDLSTGAAQRVDDIEIKADSNYTPTKDAVEWAENSTAFLFAPLYMFTQAEYYVRIRDQDVATIETTVILFHEEYSWQWATNEANYHFIEAGADIDPTGRFLMGYAEDDDANSGVVILDMETREVELVTEEYAYTAFESSSGQTVIYSHDGLFFEYDRLTKTTRQLALELPPEDIQWMTFSPDGRFVAVSGWRESDTLYVLPINP